MDYIIYMIEFQRELWDIGRGRVRMERGRNDVNTIPMYESLKKFKV